MPRRSRNEMRLGEALQVGQEWAMVDDLDVWRVRQVHRVDCVVELVCGTERKRVSFYDLRKHWEPSDHTVLEAA